MDDKDDNPFTLKIFAKIIRIFWPPIISNQDLLDECQQESIELETIIALRRRWIGHILRKDQSSIPRVSSSRMETRGTQKTRASKHDVETYCSGRGDSHGTFM